MELLDWLALIHTEKWAIETNLHDVDKVQSYKRQICEKVWLYLQCNKKVFLSRVMVDDKNIEYLKDFLPNIIILPKIQWVEPLQQWEILKQLFLKYWLSKVELAWWFEYACFWQTIKWILWEHYVKLNHQTNIWTDIFQYYSQKPLQNQDIKLYALKKNIF